MTPPDFLPLLESVLSVSGRPYDRAELRDWLESMWPWVEDDPDPEKWAAVFLAALEAPEG